MAFQGQREFVLGDAGAVVGDPDAPHAALFELHVDGRRAGVHGVFEHFLEHRGGPFDDLAGGDLIDEVVGEEVDRHGGFPDGRGRIVASANENAPPTLQWWGVV